MENNLTSNDLFDLSMLMGRHNRYLSGNNHVRIRK